MKPFSKYQYLEGDENTDRSNNEKDSKFLNKGKFDTFIAPFLPEDCTDMIFVEMGCNASLFLKLAEEHGFSKVLGFDASV